MMTIFSMVFLGLCFTACDGDDKDEIDPEGTVVANIKNYDSYDLKNHRQDSGRLQIGDFNLFMDITNNFYVNGEMVTVGAVKGLASVVSLPENGWTKYVGAIPGYAYIASVGGKYTRIYVIDYMKDSSGDIIGATIKYQYPWNPDK